MTQFITKDKDGTIFVWNKKPLRGVNKWFVINEYKNKHPTLVKFDSLKFEDEPIETYYII